LHIVFFNRSFYPDISATGQLLTDLCEDLVREHGCRVSVVTGPPLRPSVEPASTRRGLVSRETYRGVEIHRASGTRFDKRRFIGRAANYVSYFLSACWAGLRLERPDVVVSLTDPPIIGIGAWIAGRKAGAPLVMVFQDLFPEVTALLPDFHSDTINAALQAVSRFLCRRASRIVALGETMRRRLIDNKGADPARIEIIENWADTATLVPGTKPNPFSDAHQLSDRFVVMHSGNLGLSQNLEVIVDAAALLTDLTDLVVVFQGEGVKKADLQERAAARGLTNVRFLPYADMNRLTDSFATADLFIVSLQRGLAGYIVPSKLYGILAAGRPYVAAVEDDCEVTALTRRHGCGVVAAPGDAGALAEQIRALYQDRARAAAMGVRAREAALAFDRRVQVRKYFHVLLAAREQPRTAAVREART
jgi:putative colanic acid biosynthesis glycosyltransferase WcaI